MFGIKNLTQDKWKKRRMSQVRVHKPNLERHHFIYLFILYLYNKRNPKNLKF